MPHAPPPPGPRHVRPVDLSAVPLLALLRPARCGEVLASAPAPAFVAYFLASLLIYTAVLVGLMIWNETLTRVWVMGTPPPYTSAPSTALTWPAGDWEVHSRTPGEVWAEWRVSAIAGILGPAESTAIVVLVFGTLIVYVLAWLHLAFVHRSGSAWASYRRTFRVASAVVWPVALATLVCGSVCVSLEHAVCRGDLPNVYFHSGGYWLSGMVPTALVLVLLWLGVAFRRTSLPFDQSQLAPRCEGCGYDLTHRPEQGRCPECGKPVDESLVRARSRPGCAWSRSRTIASLVETNWTVLRHPSRFYRTLALRDMSDTVGYGEYSYALFMACAAIWIVVCAIAVGWQYGFEDILTEVKERPSFLLIFSAVYIFTPAVLLWVIQRVVAALIGSYWLLRGALPDFRWWAKVTIYETSFIWAFLCYWGLLTLSLVIWNRWISALLDVGPWSSTPLGMAPEEAVLVYGTLLLAVAWCWRLIVAGRAIRWGNF